MAPVEQGSAVRGGSTSSADGGHTTAALRSAARRLREVADIIDHSARTMRETARVPPCPKSVQVVADAATHVRLTADAIDYVAGAHPRGA